MEEMNKMMDEVVEKAKKLASSTPISMEEAITATAQEIVKED